MACPCQTNNTSTPPPSDCTSLTVGDFQNFLVKYQCVKAGSYFDLAEIPETLVDDRITLLNNAIADKQANPASCAYYNTLHALTEEVTRIISFTPCT